MRSYEHMFDTCGVAGWQDWQDILNCDWPDPVPQRNVRDPIPVSARVVWADDGEEHIPCMAIRWTRTHVLVDLGRDHRCSTIGAWLLATDVRRTAAKGS